jgi:nucleotide-binding universal stress UspA family protein
MSERGPRIQRVVVPLDGSRNSETAIGPGASLATRLGARLELLAARSRADTALAADYLERVEVSEAAGVVTREVATGKTALEAIVARVDDPTRLVCMATHGHTGLGEAVLGSTAEAVLHDSRRPLILVGPHCRAELAPAMKVLACVDAIEPAASLLPLAELVQALDAAIRVVTVTIVGDVVERDRVVQPDLVDHLEQLTDQLRGRSIKSDYEILGGHDIWPAINEAAEALPATLLAVTSRHRTGVGRVLLGSQAMTIVRHSRVPVIAAGTP